MPALKEQYFSLFDSSAKYFLNLSAPAIISHAKENIPGFPFFFFCARSTIPYATSALLIAETFEAERKFISEQWVNNEKL